MAAAAANAVLDVFFDQGVLDQVTPLGQNLQSRLEQAFGQHPHVGDIRGRGLFRGIEFVSDRDTKTPFDPALGLAGKLKQTAQANGLLCYPMAGTIDGRMGDHILLAPPFIMQNDDMDHLLAKLVKTVDDVLP
jgi:adenosylmethionine-8-amino-7-oxononanoate aminotransferase